MEEGLDTLTACDLVDTAVLDQHGIDHHRGLGRPKRVVEREPHIDDECMTVDVNLFGTVYVNTGGEFTESARFASERLDVNGFTAYFGDITSTPAMESACLVEFPISFTRSIEFVVKLRAGDTSYDPCRAVKDLANAALPRITTAAGEEFLYRPDESDEPTTGPCLHFNNLGTHENCVPYRETTVPDDRQQMLSTAHSNSNVPCAAALPFVHDVLGETMQPVVYGQSCIFVEPTHAISVSVFMSHAYRAGEYDFDDASNETSVSGHPAIVRNGGDSDGTLLTRDYVIAVGDDLDEEGVVGIEITVSSPRGTSSWTHKVDAAKLDAVDSIATQLMNRYF